MTGLPGLPVGVAELGPAGASPCLGALGGDSTEWQHSRHESLYRQTDTHTLRLYERIGRGADSLTMHNYIPLSFYTLSKKDLEFSYTDKRLFEFLFPVLMEGLNC